MRYGEVFWVDLPDQGGREQRGRRPAVIWQNLEAFSGLPTILVIPLTSRLAALRFPEPFVSIHRRKMGFQLLRSP
jgi:mRNA-degrading endonuclease toxin of MazEF toxin-antitoxin module